MTPLDYARLAQAAYNVAPTIGAPNSAARVVCNQLDVGLVLAAPGTNNMACIEADADALTHDAGEFGHVHAGIWNAFDAVWPEVSKLAPQSLTGHSEGALGVIFLGARLCLAGKPPAAIYAYEPPRASVDTKLAEIFKAHGVDVRIYHHARDMIPMVPPAIFGEDWQHPAAVIQFGKSSSMWPNIEPDHLIDNVVAALAA